MPVLSGLRGGVFLSMLRNFRLCWVGGRYGGGKTALSVRLAYEFLERGWVKDAVGNFPCVLFTDLHRLSECRDTFIILDEAGVWLSDKEFDNVSAFLRKRNLYVVLASVLPVPLRAKSLNIQRTWNGHSVGLNFWHYSGVLSYMQVKEKLTLSWFNPREVFGLYDTSYVTVDDAGIVKWVTDAFNKGKQDSSAVAGGSGVQGVESARGLAYALDEAAERIEAAVSIRGRKSGRR